ncbi:hypothetical protein BDY19DRAFT_889524 [Irpex rosettiformis]|uniref:Uncharacterized protein n=1 Tax=Irpex rosettiformis TaxID=378272 RepID=A0ACB8U5Y1_9APHY|nr:hypothetical protein BDY19DRAFT_889524 [Irpex rosettiformis]
MRPDSALRGLRQPWSLTSVASVFFFLSLLLKLGGTLWLRRLTVDKEYTYVGSDYPDSWAIERKPVLLANSHTVRYHIDTPAGIKEWDSVVPGDGIVHLGEHKQPFTVSVFHQLKCLALLREELVEGWKDPTGPSEMTRHCLNYVKQMIQCHGDTYLEPYAHPNHKDPVDFDHTYECKDWGAVYDAAKKNQEEYAVWREMRGGH